MSSKRQWHEAQCRTTDEGTPLRRFFREDPYAKLELHSAKEIGRRYYWWRLETAGPEPGVVLTYINKAIEDPRIVPIIWADGQLQRLKESRRLRSHED